MTALWRREGYVVGNLIWLEKLFMTIGKATFIHTQLFRVMLSIFPAPTQSDILSDLDSQIRHWEPFAE